MYGHQSECYIRRKFTENSKIGVKLRRSHYVRKTIPTTRDKPAKKLMMKLIGSPPFKARFHCYYPDKIPFFRPTYKGVCTLAET